MIPGIFIHLMKLNNSFNLHSFQLNLGNNFSLLNAGSAGNEYDIDCKKHIHIDLTEKNITNKSHYIIGSVEDLPLKNKETILYYALEVY